MDTAKLAARLGDNPVFGGLDAAALQTLLHRARLKRFAAGELVLADEDEARFVYALVSGSVRVFHCSPSRVWSVSVKTAVSPASPQARSMPIRRAKKPYEYQAPRGALPSFLG